LDEAKEIWLDGIDGTPKDHLLEQIIGKSSALIRNYLKRPELITTATLTEYHTFEEAETELYTLDLPIIAVTSIHEDTARTYAAAALLTADTHYIVNKPKGKIIRIASATAGRSTWTTGFRAVKVVYTAGYADTDSVPDDVKDVCGRHVSTVYREITKQMGGITDMSGDFGSITRLGPALLTSGMKRDLYYHKDVARSFSMTGERDT
jgi:hypothetical protein